MEDKRGMEKEETEGPELACPEVLERGRSRRALRFQTTSMESPLTQGLPPAGFSLPLTFKSFITSSRI